MVYVKLFNNYDSLKDWLLQQTQCTWISQETPLLSNLNLLENIALIDEVHGHLSVNEAEKKARKQLQGLGLEHLALKRLSQCNDQEIFQVLLLRAIAMPVEKAFILLPLSLISHEDGIKVVLQMITQLQTSITISILDLKSNQIHYQGLACHISE